MAKSTTDYTYPKLPDYRDNPTVRGDTDYRGSFQQQKDELSNVWDGDSKKDAVLRDVFLTNLVRLAWRRYSFEQDD